MGPKFSLGINSNIGLEGGGNPYTEFGVLSYVALSKRLGVMPELALRSVTFRFGSGWSADSRITSQFLFAKTNMIWQLMRPEEISRISMFLSGGLSYGQVLIMNHDPLIPNNQVTGWIFREGIFRPVLDAYIGLGFAHQISPRLEFLVHPEFSPELRFSSLQVNPGLQWEMLINISCLWRL